METDSSQRVQEFMKFYFHFYKNILTRRKGRKKIRLAHNDHEDGERGCGTWCADVVLVGVVVLLRFYFLSRHAFMFPRPSEGGRKQKVSCIAEGGYS